MQRGLNFLIKKYCVNETGILSADGKTVEIGGRKIPLLPWESERRFSELKNIFLSGRLGKICTYRIGHTVREGGDLFGVLEMEIGILEFTVGSAVKEIFAISGKRTLNCVAETANGCVCTIELGATLRADEREIDKHELIADIGSACDMAVDTQLPQKSVYVFGKNESSYKDTDAELYGYSEEQVNVIRNAFAAVRDTAVREANIGKSRHLGIVMECAKKSLKTAENIIVEQCS